MQIFSYKEYAPALSEIELLEKPYGVNSHHVDFFLDHPLVHVVDQFEMEKIIKGIKDYQSIKLYPISDKFLNKNQIIPIRKEIRLDNESHTYSFLIPSGGTKIKSLLLEFPNIPISIQIEEINLTQIPFPNKQ